MEGGGIDRDAQGMPVFLALRVEGRYGFQELPRRGRTGFRERVDEALHRVPCRRRSGLAAMARRTAGRSAEVARMNGCRAGAGSPAACARAGILASKAMAIAVRPVCMLNFALIILVIHYRCHDHCAGSPARISAADHLSSGMMAFAVRSPMMKWPSRLPSCERISQTAPGRVCCRCVLAGAMTP